MLLRFLFDDLRARLQEPISYQLTARDRLAIGDALKRVSLGYFQQMSTGSILNPSPPVFPPWRPWASA